ncbi:MAG: hypothetical protein U9Q67_01685 [Patescibacteria group bacterium]|nr:hypothetical protein [Patescibacteria group bacterium]
MFEKSVGVIVFSIITVVVWIGIEVFLGLTSKTIEDEYESHLTPMDSELNLDVVEDIKVLEDEFLLIDRDWLE